MIVVDCIITDYSHYNCYKKTMTVSILFPTNVAYSWYAIWGPLHHTVTTRHAGSDNLDLTLAIGDRLKIVSFEYEKSGDNMVYESLGVAMIEIKNLLDGQLGPIQITMSIPISTTSSAKTTTTLGVKNALITNWTTHFADLTTAVNSTFHPIQGMPTNQFHYISWQWPNLMLGWSGIADIGMEMPGWEMALPVLEWHGLGLFGNRSFDNATPAEEMDMVCVILSAIGHTMGWVDEKRDDRSEPWVKMGTNADCDDMSVATASVIKSLLHSKKGGAFGDRVRNLFTDVYVVVGMANPHNSPSGDMLHMWVEVKLKNAFVTADTRKQVGEFVVIETTAPTVFFGTTSLCPDENPLKGMVVMSNNKYSNYNKRYIYQSHTHAYQCIQTGATEMLVQLPLPTNSEYMRMVQEWQMDSPKTIPTTFTVFEPPPVKCISGFQNTDSMTDSDRTNVNVVTGKIFPWTRELMWCIVV
jgi:hypothetical protein